MGVAALVLGIVSIVFGMIPFIGWIGVICGIIAIVLGVMGKKDEAEKGKAQAGFIMGIIGVSLSLILWISCAICVSKVSDAADRLQSELEKHGITKDRIENMAKDADKALDQLKKMEKDSAE